MGKCTGDGAKQGIFALMLVQFPGFGPRKIFWIDPANKLFIFIVLDEGELTKISVFSSLRPESRPQRS